MKQRETYHLVYIILTRNVSERRYGILGIKRNLRDAWKLILENTTSDLPLFLMERDIEEYLIGEGFDAWDTTGTCYSIQKRYILP